METAVGISSLVILASLGYAQNGFDTYPIHPLIDLVQEHDTAESKKAHFVVSADPFSSNTAVFATGERRPIPKAKGDFIKLWFEARGLPPDRADALENEHRFREGNRDFWLPVVKPLEPFIETELKKDDMAVLYYFFVGGYSKTARERVFVVEEFRKTGAQKTARLPEPAQRRVHRRPAAVAPAR